MKVDTGLTSFTTFMFGMFLDAAMPNRPLQKYRPVDMEIKLDEVHHPGNDTMRKSHSNNWGWGNEHGRGRWKTIVNHLKIQETAVPDAKDAESLGSLRTLLAGAMETSHVGRYPLETAI